MFLLPKALSTSVPMQPIGLPYVDSNACVQRDGWVQVAQKGSHVQFRHPAKKGRVTVPHPERDVPLGTLKSIEKQSGLKLR